MFLSVAVSCTAEVGMMSDKRFRPFFKLRETADLDPDLQMLNVVGAG